MLLGERVGYYGYPEEISSSDASLSQSFENYKKSAYKNKLKFAFIVETGSAILGSLQVKDYWDFWNTYSVPYLVQQMQDPQYLKVDGNRPVVFWFGTKGIAGSFNGANTAPDKPKGTPNEDLAQLTDALQAVGLGAPYFVDNNMDISDAQASGFSGVTSYGPSGAVPKWDGEPFSPPEGGVLGPIDGLQIHYCWSDQAAKDQANWNLATQNGLTPVLGLTPVHDLRPRNYEYWVDHPTYSEWQKHLLDAFHWGQANPNSDGTPSVMLIYAWNELDEGGAGIIPTVQEGSMYLDAIKAVKTGYYPPVFKDVYNGDNCAIKLNGKSWISYSFPSPGAYNNDDEISDSAGEYAVLTANDAVNFEVKGLKGPDRGTMAVYIDGQLEASVDLYNPTWLMGQTLFEGTHMLDPTVPHTLKLVNASTTVNQSQIGIDAIVVTKVWDSLFDDVYKGDSSAIDRRGAAWTDWQDAGYGKEEISTEIGERAMLTVANAIGFKVSGTTGPNRGIMAVYIDDHLEAMVNLNHSAPWSENQALFTSSSPLDPHMIHTVQLVNASSNDFPHTGDPGMWPIQMGIGSIRVMKAWHMNKIEWDTLSLCLAPSITHCKVWDRVPGYAQ